MNSKYDKIQEVLDNIKAQLPDSALTVDPSAKEEWPLKVNRAESFTYEHLFDDRLTVGWLMKRPDEEG